jgi:hypothetical protein
MYEMFLQMFFGWPAMILSLVFAICGVIFKRTALSVVAALLFLLPGWYLSHYSLLFALVPLCIFGSAYASQKNRYALASLLIVPQLVFLIALAIVVLTQ